MQIGFVLLARYAEANPDGTFNVVGGDSDLFLSPSFPAVFPFSVIVKLIDLEPEWQIPGRKLPFTFDIRSSSGRSIFGAPVQHLLDPIVLPKGVRQVTRPGKSRIVINFGAIMFPEPDQYEIIMTFGEKQKEVLTSYHLLVETNNASGV
jgi:hypothetical protein